MAGTEQRAQTPTGESQERLKTPFSVGFIEVDLESGLISRANVEFFNMWGITNLSASFHEGNLTLSHLVNSCKAIRGVSPIDRHANQLEKKLQTTRWLPNMENLSNDLASL
jgi:hypothetical protein